jgi:hypothetical protein
MAETLHQGFFDDLMGGVVDTGDIRVRLLMSNTTALTDEDAQTFSDMTTVDAADGVGYVDLDCTITTNQYDTTDDRWEIHPATTEDFSGGGGTVGACTRDITVATIYRYVDGTDANDIPWYSTDAWTNLNFNPAGGDIAFTPAGAGMVIIRIAD